MDRITFLKLAGSLAATTALDSCGSGGVEQKKDLTRLKINWSMISCPFLDRAPGVASRDPALIFHGGVFRCFFTAVEGGYLYLDVTESSDLVRWSAPRRLTTAGLNFSSPGNIIRVGEKWVLCLQSYPILPGEKYGSEASRLWLMDSSDLIEWSEPRPLRSEGCQGNWTDSRRQIDPYLVRHEGKYWCLYKTSGCLGLLVSEDLESWREAVPDRPVLGPDQTPDGMTVENPCVVRDRGEFVLFFAPCRQGRGIGTARSRDLINWRDVHYLKFPVLSWADNGPTAAMVLDLRQELGRWLMAFHGERLNEPAALALAWSDNLEDWTLRAKP